jgi:hypothetical protein
MQLTNQMIMEFFSNEQVIEEMIRNVMEYDEEKESDYDSDDESNYEDESEVEDDSEEDDESEVEDEDEERHQRYRAEAQDMENELNDLPDLVSDSDSVSDTDILEDLEDELPVGPPVLRREVTTDYLSPDRMPRVSTPNAPRAERRALRDISNIRPRRLAFN